MPEQTPPSTEPVINIDVSLSSVLKNVTPCQSSIHSVSTVSHQRFCKRNELDHTSVANALHQPSNTKIDTLCVVKKEKQEDDFSHINLASY